MIHLNKEIFNNSLPQIYTIKYKFIHNNITGLLDKSVNIFTKHTMNINNNINLDIGGEFYMRNNIAKGNIITGLRFDLLNKKLFNNIIIGFGDIKYMNFETNYLYNKHYLYEIKFTTQKYLKQQNKFNFCLYNIINKNTTLSYGVQFINYFNKSNLKFSHRYVNNDKTLSFANKIKLGYENKIKTEIREKIKQKKTIVY